MTYGIHTYPPQSQPTPIPPQSKQQQRQSQQLMMTTTQAEANNINHESRPWHDTHTGGQGNRNNTFTTRQAWEATGARPRTNAITRTTDRNNTILHTQPAPSYTRQQPRQAYGTEGDLDFTLYNEYKVNAPIRRSPVTQQKPDEYSLPKEWRFPGPPALMPRDEGGEIDKLVKALGQVMNKQSLKGMHFDVPTFSGKENENFEAWESDFEQYCSLCNWDTTMRMKSLGLVLKERARQIYEDLPQDKKSTWPIVIQQLRVKFGKRTASELLDCDKLDRLQGPTESVRDYTIDVVKRLRNAGIKDEKQRLLICYRGLKPSIKRTVFLLKPSDFESCETEALLVERNLQKYGEGDGVAIDDSINAIKPQNPPKQDKHVSFQKPSDIMTNKASRGGFNGRPRSPYRARHNDPMQGGMHTNP